MIQKRFLYILIPLLILPYLLSLPVDLIDIDTAQYGEIAREMIRGNDFIHLRDHGRKYLDKPIMTFWTIAASFKVFGISAWSFRLTAVLALLAGAYSVFRLTELISENRNRALVAGLSYLSIPGLFGIVLNPIIDIYLCMYIVFAHHAYYLGFKKNKNYYYLMYLWIGIGFITKGPISAVIPAISIGGDILYRRDWKRLLEMKLLPGILIAAVPPLLWSLVLHEEFGSFGPYFFLWLQSFGRFYKKMYNQKLDPAYFYTSFLWGLATVSVFLGICAWREGWDFFSRNWAGLRLKTLQNFSKGKSDGDYVLYFWVFVYLFLIGFSRYQLPQYVYWVLPGGIIYASKFIEEISSAEFSFRSEWFYFIPQILFLSAVIAVPIFVIDAGPVYYGIIILYLVGFFFLKKENAFFSALFLPSALIFALAGAEIYPALLKYQPSREIGKKLQELEPGKDGFYSFGLPFSKRSYEFYSDRIIKNIADTDKFAEVLKKEGSRLVITPQEYAMFLEGYLGERFKMEMVGVYPAHKVATPTKEYLLKSKRESSAKKVLLIRVSLK
ncbi:MAG TPA: glycosyltransferase family 39 protein [Leptospiraceae bacterium]|nr:glycosyltransferase family 39 protein [Leptospiraceae bacterium]